MQAYATAERPNPEQGLRVLHSISPSSVNQTPAEAALLDQLLGRLADLVSERILARNEASASQPEWMDARAAAGYLGIHRDTLRKLAAQRAIPVHQDGPRCKLYFRRDELDDWRQSTPAALRAVA